LTEQQANHGGVKGESEDSESQTTDADMSVTPSRQRQRLPASAANEEPADSEDHLIQADDAVDASQELDITVGVYLLCVLCVCLIVEVLLFCLLFRNNILE